MLMIWESKIKEAIPVPSKTPNFSQMICYGGARFEQGTSAGD